MVCYNWDMNDPNQKQGLHFLGKVAQKIIVARNGKVLLTRDPRDGVDVWELPGGRLNQGEEPRQGLRRELMEELGVEFEVNDIVHVGQFFRELENQATLVLVYSGEQSNPKEVFQVDEREVAELRWFTIEEALSTKLYDVYKEALQEFNDKK